MYDGISDVGNQAPPTVLIDRMSIIPSAPACAVGCRPFEKWLDLVERNATRALRLGV